MVYNLEINQNDNDLSRFYRILSNYMRNNPKLTQEEAELETEMYKEDGGMEIPNPTVHEEPPAKVIPKKKKEDDRHEDTESDSDENENPDSDNTDNEINDNTDNNPDDKEKNKPAPPPITPPTDNSKDLNNKTSIDLMNKKYNEILKNYTDNQLSTVDEDCLKEETKENCPKIPIYVTTQNDYLYNTLKLQCERTKDIKFEMNEGIRYGH